MPKQSPRRVFQSLVAAAFLFPAVLSAQTSEATTDQASAKEEQDALQAGFGRIPNYELEVPANNVSIGVRVSGKTSVSFSGIGAITNPTMPTDDVTSSMLRTYIDGSVGVDARVDANGNPILPDGKTNTWSFTSTSQVAEDGSGVYMRAYSTVSDGSVIGAKTGLTPGFDIEFSRRIGGRKLKWGLQAGIGLTDINAKTTGEISASLHSLTDFYSLLGAAAPTALYTAPTFDNASVTNPDGTTSSVQTDTSVLLANTPTERSDVLTESGAQIAGFWQVKGAYFSARLGSWIEMPISSQFTIRASGGLSGRVIGAFMRFDERFQVPDTSTELNATDQTGTDTWGMFGGYASLEAQYWLTERSGFFAGASYEAVSGEVDLHSGDRLARLNLDSGAGLRFGFTTRF